MGKRKHRKHSARSSLRRPFRSGSEIICGLPSDLWKFEIFSFLDLLSVLKMMRINQQFCNYINKLDDLEFWRDIQFKNLESWASTIKNDSFIYENFMKTNEKILSDMKRLKFKQIVIDLYWSFWVEVKGFGKKIKTYLNLDGYNEPMFDQQPIKELSFHMVQPNTRNYLQCIVNPSALTYYGSWGPKEVKNVNIDNVQGVPLLRIFHGDIQVSRDGFSYKTEIPSQTHTICGFNRFDRDSWVHLKRDLMEFVNKPFPIILVGLDWREYPEIGYSLEENYNCNNGGYVNFSEIIKFCSANQISAYIDAKISDQDDTKTTLDHITRVSLLDFGIDRSLLYLNEKTFI